MVVTGKVVVENMDVIVVVLVVVVVTLNWIFFELKANFFLKNMKNP